MKKNILILDTETTGLKPLVNEVFQISYIIVNRDDLDKTLKVYNKYILPTEPIPPKITEITGITDKDLFKINATPLCHFDFTEVIKDLAENIVVGYNVNFDINMLIGTYSKQDKLLEVQPMGGRPKMVVPDKVCMLAAARANLRLTSYKLIDVFREISKNNQDVETEIIKFIQEHNIKQIGGNTFHTAMYDVLATREVMKWLKVF